MGASERSAGVPSHAEVCRLYESGVAAVMESARSWAPGDWTTQACGEWDRADTVRHLCAISA